jgi:hypothetical protein
MLHLIEYMGVGPLIEVTQKQEAESGGTLGKNEKTKDRRPETRDRRMLMLVETMKTVR